MATRRGLRGWTDVRARGYKQGWAEGRAGRRASRRSKSSQNQRFWLVTFNCIRAGSSNFSQQPECENHKKHRASFTFLSTEHHLKRNQ